MKRYESYKDSGVKWLGEIPGHWEVRKIKYTFKERSQKGFPKLSLLSATQQYGVIKKDDYENRTVVATKGLDTLKLVCKNDFVISLRSFEGGIEMSHEEGIISPAYTILIPKKIEPSYFRHLGKTPVFINLLKMMVTGIREGQNIDYNKLRTNLIPIPPKSEQTAIANYLDSVTSKIDEAISQQQKMIDLLNERKQIIIQNAVTKGLDPNAKMKDSGVEWIGEIPEDWEVLALKYCCSLKARIGWNGLKSEEFEEYSYAYLVTGQDFKGSMINWKKCYQINQKRYEEDPYIQINNGDLLITKDGTIGKIAKVINLDKPACLNSGIFVIKQTKNMYIQDYLFWMLSSNVLKEFNRFTQTGATIAHLYQNVFEQMPCVLPCIEEQRKISSFLNNSISKIDYSISQCNKMISLLQERKQIIINDVVTGKVKVV